MSRLNVLPLFAISTLLSANLAAYAQSPTLQQPNSGSLIAQSNANLDNYIFGLKYDPRRLLSFKEAGSTETIPGGKKSDRTEGNNKVVVCTKEKRGLQKDFSSITLMRPTQGAVFPGALVRINRNLAEGLPDALSLPRAAATISVDLPGLRGKGIARIENPTNSSVQSAINKMLEIWNDNPASQQGYVNAANSTTSYAKAYNSDQLSLELGFNADWADNNLTSRLTVDNTSKRSVTAAFFKQVFYTVTMDAPTQPSSVFDPSVTMEQFQRLVNNDNPPGYVSSVDYGRIMMVKMETNSNETEVDLEATLKYMTTGGANLEPSVKMNYERIAKNSEFTVYTLGGNADVSAQLLASGQMKDFRSIIRENATYSRSNPGLPVSYMVKFLKDNSVAKLGFTTDYIATECKEYNNGYVTVWHDGGYVGKFQVAWSEPDATGKMVPKVWNSGDKTAGYKYQIDLPGDARNVRVVGWAATGLLWDPWGQMAFPALDGPNNKCYRFYGTTLDRKTQVRDAC